MSNVIKEIMNQLESVFVDMDSKVLEATKKWALERRDAVNELLDSVTYDDCKSILDRAKKNTSTRKQAYIIAGGKTWFYVLQNSTDESILDFVEKNCKAVADKRNAKIANKLELSEVTEILKKTYEYTNDGFNGTFEVMTNQGTKLITISTIYAGGYNIQCLHLRVLVKVK